MHRGITAEQAQRVARAGIPTAIFMISPKLITVCDAVCSWFLCDGLTLLCPVLSTSVLSEMQLLGWRAPSSETEAKYVDWVGVFVHRQHPFLWMR